MTKALLFSMMVLGGCGGSSSETPFPLEPDRATLRAVATPSAPGSSAKPFDPADVNDESIREGEGPATTTWGGAKRPSKSARPPDLDLELDEPAVE
ncbi:MAG TPA: hypothetical protein PKA88_10860 [Polyangiaceae bacterium]|nr:hypothetical protein [Polyangiaceae bacterium]HMR75353.1 hypothetical protein [Polyangiaceae bacterium]